jgi:membrane protease YdiL (CAAX protease family)
MTTLEYGIQPRPAPALARAAPALPYFAVLLGVYGFSSAWTALLLYQAGVIALIVATGDSSWWRRFRGWNTGWGIGFIFFGAGGGLLFHLLWPLLGLEDLRFQLSQLGLSGAGVPIFLLYFAIVHPWLEELLWRDYLAGTSPLPEMRDLLFAGYHALVLRFFLEWYWVIVSVSILLGAAWIWRRLAIRFQGVLLPTISHLAGDLCIVLVVLHRSS